MSKTLKQFIIAYYDENGWAYSNQDLYETFEDTYNIVYKSDEDEHRWYTLWSVVRLVNIDGVDRFFEDTLYDMHGEDADRDDVGFEAPDLDDLVEVFPKQILTTIYVTKDKL